MSNNKSDKRAANKKQQNAKNNYANGNISVPKRPTLTLNKRNEVTALVKKLMIISFIETNSPKADWDLFVSLNELLQKVVELEAVLQRPYAESNIPTRLQKFNEFSKWAKENGCECADITVTEFPGYGLGLKAERDIAKGEPVISVPFKLMLTEENSQYERMQSKFGVMSNLKLTYILIFEALKPDSFWAPYFQILPNEFTSVGYFNAQHMEQLRGSNALPAALKLYRSIVRQYALIYDMLQKMPRLKNKDVQNFLKDNFSYEMYR